MAQVLSLSTFLLSHQNTLVRPWSLPGFMAGHKSLGQQNVIALPQVGYNSSILAAEKKHLFGQIGAS